MTKLKNHKKPEQKQSVPLGKVLSVIFFFLFAPKLIRGAWEMGYDYTNGENSSGFFHLTKKDANGFYKGKYRVLYSIGIIASSVLIGILCVLAYFIWHSFKSKTGIVAKLFVIAPACIATLVVILFIVFLWVYLHGQISGLRKKVTEVNEKLSKKSNT